VKHYSVIYAIILFMAASIEAMKLHMPIMGKPGTQQVKGYDHELNRTLRL
jgi:hypothetical protein